MSEVSLREQIEEVERELALRKRVYAGQVYTGKMRQSVADYHMNRMQAVRDTLTRLQEKANKTRAKTD
jgi:hypothetical protein